MIIIAAISNNIYSGEFCMVQIYILHECLICKNKTTKFCINLDFANMLGSFASVLPIDT